MSLVEFRRSESGCGWSLMFGRRVRWNSRKVLTPMWPHIYRGADENCNRSISLHLWPFGGLDVWWEPRQRTDLDGPCETCRQQFRDDGCCEWCGSRPCCCDIFRNVLRLADKDTQDG